MSLLIKAVDRRVETVLHPTDLSRASLTAFHHALALGVRFGAQLTLLHAIGRRSTDSWPNFPSIRSTLALWHSRGPKEEEEPTFHREAFRKLEVRTSDPVAASMRFVRRRSVDLIVLATGGRSGLSRLVRPSRAERLARASRVSTLFVPSGSRPFVSSETGEVALDKIVIPVARGAEAKPAMLLAVRTAVALGNPNLEITLLHVGRAGDELSGDAPELPFCRWSVLRRSGDVVDEILQVTDELQADAVFMTTTWARPSLRRRDVGVTERVLHAISCPLVAVPR